MNTIFTLSNIMVSNKRTKPIVCLDSQTLYHSVHSVVTCSQSSYCKNKNTYKTFTKCSSTVKTLLINVAGGHKRLQQARYGRLSERRGKHRKDYAAN
uniref:Uncharacterized protein n=1 Tax=Arundo donax TaxID=35708 RepID=A0A0A9GUT8_ARUDO